jgi:hypothetical protein
MAVYQELVELVALFACSSRRDTSLAAEYTVHWSPRK